MPFYLWSQTAASNATADSTVNYAEGQAPSSLNDSARAAMARLREYGNDIAGAIVTGGTATAYTVTSNQVFDTLAHLNGQVIAFTPHATSTNTVGNDVTLNVDSLGAKPIRMQPSVALPGGTLVLGTPYVVLYNSSDAVFYLQNMTNPYAIPLGGGIDFWGSTTPNSSFAFPTGQAISRTTYATLFSLIGTTYGTGDGSTTFNLPDKTGRVSAMKEASATRLTSSWFVGNSTTLGATGFNEKNALSSTNQLPQFTPSTSTATSTTPLQGDSSHTGSNVSAGLIGNNGTGATQASNTLTLVFNSIGSASPSSFATGQPTIICNYIIRII